MKLPESVLDGVRSSVRSGRPYGAEDWVEVISHRLGIVGEPRRRGRPPREKMLRHRNSLTGSSPEFPRKDALTPEFPLTPKFPATRKDAAPKIRPGIDQMAR